MMKWLEQQPDANPTTPQETVDNSPLKLLETMKVNLVVKFGGITHKIYCVKIVGIYWNRFYRFYHPQTFTFCHVSRRQQTSVYLG